MVALDYHHPGLDDVLEAPVGGSISPALVTAAADPAAGPDHTAAVAGVFEKVLGVAPVAADDDFFELGGDSTLAMTLVLDVEATLGASLPMTAPFAAPTPRALAALIAQQTQAAAGGPQPMKPGLSPPLFILPGASGTTLELLECVGRLDTPRAIFGLEAAGLHGECQPLDRIEPMAEYQIAAIRRVQPTGPYWLAGYSMGGLVAYEMARRLAEAGETVAMVALIDTIYPRQHIPMQARMQVACRRAAYHLRATLRMSPLSAVAYLGRSARNVFKKRPSGGAAGRHRASASTHDGTRAVFDAAVAAARTYRPGRFDGPVMLLWAHDDAPYSNLDLAWRCRARALSVRLIPGDHDTCLAAAGGALAAALPAAEFPHSSKN
jgi:acetoacetyl-CoA synthetase